MAARFWVTGGTGNWNSTSNWSATSGGASGASVPSTADTATFDASSGSGTATLDISPTIQTLTCTGFTGTLAFGTNTISLNSTGTIFTGATTMTVTGTPLIICTNSSATARTISPAAVTESNTISFRVTAGTGTVSTGTGSCRNLDFTDGVNPTGFSGVFGAGNITLYGNLNLSTGMTTLATTNAITFAATSGTKTINTAGVTFDRPFTFNGVGGTWQLVSALTSGATRAVTLTNGTLDLNGYTLTTGFFTGTGSGVRRLVTNSVPIVITGNSATVVNFGTTTNYTVDVTPTFNLTYSGSVGTRTISVGATSNFPAAPNITVTAGSDIVTTSGTTTLTNLIFTSGFTGTFGNATRNIYGNLTFVSGMAIPTAGSLVTTFNGVGSQTITTAGLTLDFPITFDGVGGTWTLQDTLTSGATRTVTLTNGTLNLNGYTLSTGFFSSSNSNTRTLAFGTGKIVLTGNAGTVFSTGTFTNLTVTGTSLVQSIYSGSTGTRIIAFGTGAISEANAINFEITAGSDTVSLFGTGGAAKNINFTGFSGTIDIPSIKTIYGNWDSGSATVYSGTSTITFAATSGTKTIRSGGLTWGSSLLFNGVGGTWSLQDALTLTGQLNLTNGALSSNGYLISTGSFSSIGTGTRALSLSGGSISLTNTGTVWTTSGTGFSMGSTDKISLSSATAQTLSGGGLSLGTVSIANSATKTITGNNTFYDIVNTVTPATINFQASSTNSFSNVNLNGASGSLVTLRSTVSGSQYTLAKI